MFGSPPDPAPRVRIVRPRRPPALFACGKCLRKAEEGRAIRRALKEVLSDRTAEGGRKPPRLARTACLGLCPKGAVVLASAATLARGEVVLVRDAAEVAGAAATLLPGLRTGPPGGQAAPATGRIDNGEGSS